jgi:hypothetical protein
MSWRQQSGPGEDVNCTDVLLVSQSRLGSPDNTPFQILIPIRMQVSFLS